MANSFTPQQIEQFLREFFDVVGARQYIGARYVPIFGRKGEDTVEWDDLAPYEPLTVVMHLGVSYVSRQYVPTGTPITDTDFWVETYRFNAQVEQYRQEVLSFQGQIDQLRDDMESDYVPFPDPASYPKYGTEGQVLTTLTNGETMWDDPVHVTADVAEPLISEWLDEHPEATTTVLDNSVTDAKLIQSGGLLSNALKVYPVLVQSNNYASILPDLDTATENMVYKLNLTSQSTEIPANLPFTTTPYGEVFTLVTLQNLSNPDNIGALQFLLGRNSDVWKRGKGANWTPWVGVESNAEKSAIKEQCSNALKVCPLLVQSDNYAQLLPDLNDITDNMIYKLNYAASDSNLPSNMPFSQTPYGEIFTLVSIATKANAQNTACIQYLLGRGKDVWRRGKGVSEWNAWTQISSDAEITTINTGLSNSISVYPTMIQADNYTTLLPDLNNITDNMCYKLNYGAYDTNVPANCPWTKTPYGDIFMLFSIANKSNAQNVGCMQYMLGHGGDVWRRVKGTTWKAWRKISENGNIITVGANNCDYTALVPAIIEGVKSKNSHIYVMPGTYDFVSEIETYISGTFFTNYDESNPYARGINIENGITIEMMSGAKITCNYTGNNARLRSVFSPLQARYGDFTLINVTIEASNVRYCVHDDNVVKNQGACHHTYIGCNFTLDNTALQGSPDTCACVGGGLDKNTFIEMRDCYLNSLGAPTRDIVTDPTIGCAGYHNVNIADALSNIVISGCYAEHGTFTFGKYGPSTKVTPVLISNCSVKSAPRVYYEVPGEFQVDNMVMRSWNNEVRV